MVDFPAPLGPSMLMNMPRSWLEKGRNLICASGIAVRFPAAKLFERDRISVMARGEPDKQAGRDQHVVSSAVGYQPGRHLAIQGQCFDQRAELVTRLAREQPPGELERVEYLGIFPFAQFAPEYPRVHVRVVGDEHPAAE